MTIASLSFAAVALAGAQTPAPQLAGQWEGRVAVSGQSLRVVIRVDASGGAVMDSPDQNVTGLPVTGLGVENGVVRFAVPAASGRFEGTLSEDGATLTGALSQGPVSMPLVLTRTSTTAVAPPAAPVRPQEPHPPFPYRAEDVAIDTPTPGVRLAGTLTTPQGAGPFPAVLLITGSGQQDRDETIFGHKPFLLLADALTRRGIAVLRVDDRGVGGSTGPVETATSADFGVDAAAAFAWLVARPEIADARVGLLGHSEGGTIAPLVARADPRVAWIVMMAGPAVSGGEVLTEQSRRFQAAGGIPAAVVDANAAVQARIMAAIAANADDGAAASQAVRDALAGLPVPAPMVEQAAAQAALPWMRWFVAHDPRPGLASLRIPVLALYGGKDVQVPAEQSAAALREVMPSAEVVVLPDLNHLMQTAGTGLPAEYGTIEETIDPEALNRIVDWIAAR